MTIDLYSNAAKTQTTYVIPGPPLFGTGGSGGSPGSSAPPTVRPSSTLPCTASLTVPYVQSQPAQSTTAAPSTPTQVGTVAQYGQCGGQGWSGATACIAPWTCTKLNGEQCPTPTLNPATHTFGRLLLAMFVKRSLEVGLFRPNDLIAIPRVGDWCRFYICMFWLYS